jgi:hypothetical protein
MEPGGEGNMSCGSSVAATGTAGWGGASACRVSRLVFERRSDRRARGGVCAQRLSTSAGSLTRIAAAACILAEHEVKSALP